MTKTTFLLRIFKPVALLKVMLHKKNLCSKLAKSNVIRDGQETAF